MDKTLRDKWWFFLGSIGFLAILVFPELRDPQIVWLITALLGLPGIMSIGLRKKNGKDGNGNGGNGNGSNSSNGNIHGNGLNGNTV